MYDLILFDLDGTLTYPEEGITKSVCYALESFGIVEEDMNKLRRFIGPPLIDAFTEFYGMSREDGLKAVEKYRERFRDKGIYENELIENVPKMLETLKNNGKKIALATSKPYVFAAQIMEHFDLSKYFDCMVGAEFDGTRNEKAEVIAEVLRQFPDAKNPVMVGDRKQDCVGAKKNDIPCIGVAFGFAEDGELEEGGAEKVAQTVMELLEVLLK